MCSVRAAADSFNIGSAISTHQLLLERSEKLAMKASAAENISLGGILDGMHRYYRAVIPLLARSHLIQPDCFCDKLHLKLGRLCCLGRVSEVKMDR